MSNFTVTNAPDKQPAHDFLTHSATGPFVDTGFDVRDQAGRILGRVYLSFDTIRHLADVAGVLNAPAPEALLAEYNKGLVDGMKENIGGDTLARVARTFERALDTLPGDLGSAG